MGTLDSYTSIEYNEPDLQFSTVNPDIKDAQSYNDQNATIVNKATDLVSTDNPLLSVERTRAKQVGESRGLLNTAGNIRAGEGAVLDKAYQLVSPDAAAEQSRISAQQAAENQGALTTQASQYGWDSANQQASITGALNEQNQEFEQRLAQMGYDQQNITALSGIYGNLVDSQMGAMSRIMSTPDNNWDQTKQDDFENVINSSKSWLASLFDIPLS